MSTIRPTVPAPDPSRGLPRRRFGGLALAASGTALTALPAAAQAHGHGGGHHGGGHHGSGKERRTIEKLLRGMSLDEKIGQMFIAVGYGSTADEERKENTDSTGVGTIAEIVTEHKVGGLIYFAWSDNVDSPRQTATLSNQAQQAALDAGMIPLSISTDEEEGVVTRMPEPQTALPGSMALGASRSTRDAARAARITGAEGRALGITQIFAPDGDVNVEPLNPVIGVRSFGSDPELVADLVAAQVPAMQENASASVKHFPGHGDTATDSHLGLPVIDHSREQLDEIDLPPFRKAIAAGIDSIMTGHLMVPALDDSGVPATLSHTILTGLLREELGFDGVIFTDSLAMEGVRTLFSDDRVPVEAILAGADQMLMPPDLAVAIGGVRAAVEAGEITEERLNESMRRILALKLRRGVIDEPLVDVDAVGSVVGTKRSARTAEDIADDTVTLIRDEGTLPLARRSSVLVTGWGTQETLDHLASTLRSGGLDATTQVLETLATATAAKPAVAARASTAAEVHDAVVVTTYSSGFETPAAQTAVVKALIATGIPVIHVALRNPYDVVQLGAEPAASLATYSTAPCALHAVARVISGRHQPTGKLPVAVPTKDGSGEAFPYGYGLGFAVRPDAPRLQDRRGRRHDAVRIPRSETGRYAIDGRPAQPGSHRLRHEVEVTVRPRRGVRFAADATTSWTFAPSGRR